MMDIDVTDVPELSGGGGGPQSVPLWISVVFVFVCLTCWIWVSPPADLRVLDYGNGRCGVGGK